MREQDAREKADAIGGRHKSGKEMREDTITKTMKRSNQLQKEMTFMKEMLIGNTTPTQEQEGRAKRKGKAKVNDEGKASNDPPAPKNETLLENEEMV